MPTDGPMADAVVDASAVSDAPAPPRDPVGRWSCDLLGWSEGAMRYDAPVGAEPLSVTVTRSARGISWRIEMILGLSEPVTVPLVAGGDGWHLEGPFRNPLASPMSSGMVDRFDVSWRGERLQADMRGTSGEFSPRPARFLFDCARAP
jgi:hypothetical protein